MASLWRIDSPFMQKMTKVTNLLLLNLLWVLCSLPILTVGAATTAMYSVLFAWRRQETDSVVKPFFVAFKKALLPATLYWIVLLILGVALIYDIILLIFGAETQLFLCIPVIIVGLLVIIVTAYLFPQLALFDNKHNSMLKNCLLLFILYPIQSIAIIILMAFPLVLFLCLPEVFWFTFLFWSLIGISLCANIASFLLWKIFERYIPKSEESIPQS